MRGEGRHDHGPVVESEQCQREAERSDRGLCEDRTGKELGDLTPSKPNLEDKRRPLECSGAASAAKEPGRALRRVSGAA